MSGNDFIQSIFADDRHRQFDSEVEKDRLAKLASPRVTRRPPRVVAAFAPALARWGTRRGAQRRVQRASTSMP
jgi:hypothetical protein